MAFGQVIPQRRPHQLRKDKIVAAAAAYGRTVGLLAVSAPHRPENGMLPFMITPDQTPGIDQQPNFLRAGYTVQYDYRDLPTGPRAGGNYYLHFRRYWDQDLGRHTFNSWDTAVEQYFPYWNKTRVVALRLAMVATQAGEGQTVPFYLEPTLGGNDFLRGFERYRFYDQSSLLLTAEHRWHLFSGGHAAIFADAGKVAPGLTQLSTLAKAKYAGGIGFRFTLRDAVIMRLDNAISNEGYRFMWTFSNMW